MLSLLRVTYGLSVHIEVNLVYTGLAACAWLRMPFALAQLDPVEFLHGEAPPDTTAWGQSLGTITASSKLVAEDIQSAGLSAPNVRAKQSRLPIISGDHRLPAIRCRTEEFINLPRGWPIGMSGHLS